MQNTVNQFKDLTISKEMLMTGLSGNDLLIFALFCKYSIKFSQKEIGQVLNIARETTNRALNRLCEKGFLTVFNRAYRVADRWLDVTCYENDVISINESDEIKLVNEKNNQSSNLKSDKKSQSSNLKCNILPHNIGEICDNVSQKLANKDVYIYNNDFDLDLDFEMDLERVRRLTLQRIAMNENDSAGKKRLVAAINKIFIRRPKTLRINSEEISFMRFAQMLENIFSDNYGVLIDKINRNMFHCDNGILTGVYNTDTLEGFTGDQKNKTSYVLKNTKKKRKNEVKNYDFELNRTPIDENDFCDNLCSLSYAV